ncbi:TVP38/TMEM64 family protein [Amylibacter marinus]|uniref:TVP38/TMEM64 family membrane protein n=1 Tax=Amylibacter marinus TaxID=1475483 RepID=A0ABQ5VUW0_9RHOB|nr:TVP38/TMEM64 family protein [Amylibacter marinus]GLQ35013.1 TVP38/TMEM64 family protein [Amylibacter marinus]
MNIRKMIPLGVIALGAGLGAFFLRDIVSFENLAANQEALSQWRDNNYVIAALVFVALYVVAVAFSLPGATILTLTGGFLFGIFPGALFNILGASIGACAIFIAAKTGLGDSFAAKLGDSQKSGFLDKMEKEIRQNEVSYLLLMRLVPAVPFFVANLAPAFVGVSLRRFAWTTFFGIMPGAVVYTSVGAGLGEIFARGETPNLGIIFEPHILGPILGLAALAALPILISKFKKETAP